MRHRSVWAVALALLFGVLLLAADSGAETAGGGNLRVDFSGKLSPHVLPRHGSQAVSVTIGGHVHTTDGSSPPQLRRIELAINSHGHIDYRHLPACRFQDIQPSTDAKALQACGDARVGEGSFSADVAASGQAPFPSRGRLIAFNGVLSCAEQHALRAGRPLSSRLRMLRAGRSVATAPQPGPNRARGRFPRCHSVPVIFAHVYGTEPLPTSYTAPFLIGHSAGPFPTTLTAYLPRVTGKAGFITGIELSLHRTFRYHGERRTYLAAGCPAPSGFSLVPYPLLRATFTFAGKSVSAVLHRTCRAAADDHGGPMKGRSRWVLVLRTPRSARSWPRRRPGSRWQTE